jgi:hypothetical protein
LDADEGLAHTVCYYTKNPPSVDPRQKRRHLTRQRELLEVLDVVSADYFMNRAMNTGKLTAQAQV